MSLLAQTFGARGTLHSASDFHQYKKHIRKRVWKLRKDLGIQVKDTKHYQEKQKTFEIDSGDYDSDERYGLVLLNLAERDLAYALEISSVSEVSSSRSKEKFILSKYKRGVQYSKQLVEISFNEKSTSKKVEIYTYYAILQGVLLVKQKKWTLGSLSLSVARNALEFLEEYGEYTEAKQSHLYRELIESYVDPSLNVAILHSSYSGGLNVVSKIIIDKHSELEETFEDLLDLIKGVDRSFLELSVDDKEVEKKLIDKITWINYSAKLNNSDTARSIMKVENLKTVDSDIATYDPVLLGWQEILESHEADIERSAGYEDSDESRDLQIIQSYIKYNLYFVKVRRDLALVAELQSKSNLTVDGYKDILRIYDIVLATIKDIQDLPGVYSDQDLLNDVLIFQAFVEGSKLSIVSKVYGLATKHRQALLILASVDEKLASTGELTTKFPGKVFEQSKLDDLKAAIIDAKDKAHVLAQFELELGTAGRSKTVAEAPQEVSYVGSLKDLKKAGSLINIKQIKPVSLKPVFFDLAYNYIGETDESVNTALSTKPSEESGDGEDDKPKKKGLFGLWG